MQGPGAAARPGREWVSPVPCRYPHPLDPGQRSGRNREAEHEKAQPPGPGSRQRQAGPNRYLAMGPWASVSLSVKWTRTSCCWGMEKRLCRCEVWVVPRASWLACTSRDLHIAGLSSGGVLWPHWTERTYSEGRTGPPREPCSKLQSLACIAAASSGQARLSPLSQGGRL